MSQEATNTQLVKDAYAAFGRGDVPGILEHLADDVDWHPLTGAGPQVPHAKRRHGKAQVAEFFKELGHNVQFSRFEPREFVAQGDKVVVLGHYTSKVVATGKTIDSDFVMVFTIRHGKAAVFQEFTDSAGVNAAFTK